MKNKKSFIINIILTSIFSFLIYKIVDMFYFKEISQNVNLRELGYKNSLIIFENRFLLFIILFIISILFSLILYFLQMRKEKYFSDYYKTVKNRLEAISKGDYTISIQEIDKLGSLYDGLYKLILELREKSEINYKDKLEIKKYLEDISHQLKTPLASMEIMVELLQMKNSSETLDNMEKELKKMNYLISSLLSLARFETNQVNLNKENISIEEVLNTSIESLHSLIDDLKITVELKGANFFVEGDYSWLVEAFINVIKNSIEHSKERVLIYYESKNTYSEIRIQDDGPGFPKKDLTKIFHRFYKSRENSPGVGIGLNLSMTILEKHKATISAENSSGGVFIIKFY